MSNDYQYKLLYEYASLLSKAGLDLLVHDADGHIKSLKEQLNKARLIRWELMRFRDESLV